MQWLPGAVDEKRAGSPSMLQPTLLSTASLPPFSQEPFSSPTWTATALSPENTFSPSGLFTRQQKESVSPFMC